METKRIQAIVKAIKEDPNLMERVEAMIAPPSGSMISGAEEAAAMFRPRFEGLHAEELHAVYLNRRNRCIAYRVLTRGNEAHTTVDPRQVLGEALRLRASGVIMAHNHPSGDVSPSSADIEVTTRMANAARLLGIEVLDHLVVADVHYNSLREMGYMPFTPSQGIMAASKGLRYTTH